MKNLDLTGRVLERPTYLTETPDDEDNTLIVKCTHTVEIGSEGGYERAA